MSLASLFTPETIKTYYSGYSGQIKLIRFAGQLRLDAGGLTQSGDVMVGIFRTGLDNLLPQKYQPENILLLGLGGGSVIKFLRRRYPRTKLTAVEIDPVMIDIARRHFHIDRVENFKIINTDAVEYIKKTKQKFSLILNDCYLGNTTPAGFDDSRIITKMKSLTDYLLINRLYWDDFKLTTDAFVTNLSRRFRIQSVYTGSNLVISLS